MGSMLGTAPGRLSATSLDELYTSWEHAVCQAAHKCTDPGCRQRFELSRVGEPPTEGTPEPQADTYRCSPFTMCTSNDSPSGMLAVLPASVAGRLLLRVAGLAICMPFKLPAMPSVHP